MILLSAFAPLQAPLLLPLAASTLASLFCSVRSARELFEPFVSAGLGHVLMSLFIFPCTWSRFTRGRSRDVCRSFRCGLPLPVSLASLLASLARLSSLLPRRRCLRLLPRLLASLARLCLLLPRRRCLRLL